MSKHKELLTCRQILTMMVMLSFIVQYMIRGNMSIAIIDMTSTNSSQTNIRHFAWNEEEKNDVLGIYYIGYMSTNVLGGRLSEVYGSRRVIGIALLFGSLLTLLTPIAAYIHYYCLLAVRCALGLSFGVLWPASLPLAARWVPRSGSSTFLAQSSAVGFGVAITLAVCGFLIAHLGWPSVFYVTGGVPLLWTLLWFYLVYDTPKQHPRISTEERSQLERDVDFDPDLIKSAKIPWGKILTSRPVWAIIVANAGSLFGYYFLVNEIPTYMHQILHYRIEENGVLSSLPFMSTYFGAQIASYFADKWIGSRTFHVITVRKLFSGITLLFPAFLLLIQSVWGYNRPLSFLVFTLYLTVIGCYSCSYYANCLDIAPAYAGSIYGIANMAGSIAGYLSTKIVGHFTKEEQTFQQWKYVFWSLAAVNVFSALFYFNFASGDLQKWHPQLKEEETVQLNCKSLTTESKERAEEI